MGRASSIAPPHTPNTPATARLHAKGGWRDTQHNPCMRRYGKGQRVVRESKATMATWTSTLNQACDDLAALRSLPPFVRLKLSQTAQYHDIEFLAWKRLSAFNLWC